ncbi:uncharacterized protein LOC128966417 [Oppia nitens]|uniref:uncharacterized protein LOC128966417 n=1 Tax=Oppia nitens TaxID=1686743 RepID=UPI0023DCD322|nr:uncharacterized protein LOC128966417 [Oppia nitens]
MLSSSIKRLNRSTRLMTADDISDSAMANRPSAAFNQCWYYLQQSAYDRALDESTKIIRREPNNPEGYVLKSRSLFQLKRYEESEDVLLQVMRIAEQTQLTRTDMEGVVKLKDELANSRVEILRANNFREPMDIAEMHWNDYHKPILDLIGFASLATYKRGSGGSGGGHNDDRPMEVDQEIIDIVGPERARQLYPDLLIDTPKAMSTPNQRRDVRPLAAATDYTNRSSSSGGGRPQAGGRSGGGTEDDSSLRAAGLKTSLMLAEEKGRKLESELKKVYEHLLKLNGEKKQLERKCRTLEDQLDKALAGGGPGKQRHRQHTEVIDLEPQQQYRQQPIRVPTTAQRYKESVATSALQSSTFNEDSQLYGTGTDYNSSSRRAGSGFGGGGGGRKTKADPYERIFRRDNQPQQQHRDNSGSSFDSRFQFGGNLRTTNP